MTPTREAILESLKEVYDPEIPVDIVNLGLVYDVAADGGRVTVTMTMTSPGCPVGDFLAQEVERVIRALGDVETVRVQLVWDPPWSPEKMSVQGRKILGW
ncbi:MAG TPA: metal-sulfur cluster assembly factor [Methylomirabilota bacterium]|nr:metal-sulfur cluster assembly factor [Methylomirabilota bacterium]